MIVRVTVTVGASPPTELDGAGTDGLAGEAGAGEPGSGLGLGGGDDGQGGDGTGDGPRRSPVVDATEVPTYMPPPCGPGVNAGLITLMSVLLLGPMRARRHRRR